MKISVITASFNQGPFIKKCVDSVRRQTGDFQIEHIILDNCSTDETAELLEEYKSNPGHVDVKLLVKPDKGQTAAINEGFAMATGDVVCWLNTDEWYEDGAFQSVVEYFHTNPDVDVVFGDCNFVDTKGRLVKQKREFFFSKSMLIFYGCYMPSCATFLRRKILDSGIYLDPEFKVTMDFDWYVRIAKAGFVIRHLSRTLASFTWHDTNISKVFNSRRKFELNIVRDRYSNINFPKIIRRPIFLLMRCFWIFARNLLRVKRSGFFV